MNEQLVTGRKVSLAIIGGAASFMTSTGNSKPHSAAALKNNAVMRDPYHLSRLLPKYDSGDHVHPYNSSHAAIADAVYSVAV
jgi:hypothetical protein